MAASIEKISTEGYRILVCKTTENAAPLDQHIKPLARTGAAEETP
jgi:hypothetical protein